MIDARRFREIYVNHADRESGIKPLQGGAVPQA